MSSTKGAQTGKSAPSTKVRATASCRTNSPRHGKEGGRRSFGRDVWPHVLGEEADFMRVVENAAATRCGVLLSGKVQLRVSNNHTIVGLHARMFSFQNQGESFTWASSALTVSSHYALKSGSPYCRLYTYGEIAFEHDKRDREKRCVQVARQYACAPPRAPPIRNLDDGVDWRYCSISP